MNSADLQTIVNGVVELAAIGAGWSLVYFRRILLAASPKPQLARQGDAEVKGKTDAGDKTLQFRAAAGGKQ